MTREEAIKVLTHLREIIRTIPKALCKLPNVEERKMENIIALQMAIESLQVETVQGWRKGKPTEQGEYMVTLDAFGHRHIDLFYYGKPLMPNRKVRGKCWYRSDDEWGDVVYDDKDILAWMPLPKPYREDGE